MANSAYHGGAGRARAYRLWIGPRAPRLERATQESAGSDAYSPNRRPPATGWRGPGTPSTKRTSGHATSPCGRCYNHWQVIVWARASLHPLDASGVTASAGPSWAYAMPAPFSAKTTRRIWRKPIEIGSCRMVATSGCSPGGALADRERAVCPAPGPDAVSRGAVYRHGFVEERAAPQRAGAAKWHGLCLLECRWLVHLYTWTHDTAKNSPLT